MRCKACAGEGIAGEYVPELCGEGEDRTCEACDGTGQTPDFWTVAVYLIDRAYGGPEEGGWWYDCGEPVTYRLDGIEIGELCRLFADRSEARAWRAELQTKLDNGPNKGRREISSVLSEGMYAAELREGYPKPWPEQRPHYE